MDGVDTNISDLFFNTDHATTVDNKGTFENYSNLEDEGKMFLACLKRLGVAVPTLPQLIADFLGRT